ncbi:DUF1766-domain-containing protein [Myriangium duriaei CBS 260.36]|uniref:DUF1766-domain-containing protein n=1 Tax=Myriangium duriaei CBS 260.36 TaxID=1168546 RepID=A0A9P4J387_9PEZI|nr:DUF1766-domain-containing protein [Myriangium duriaei CBS 260.36]
MSSKEEIKHDLLARIDKLIKTLEMGKTSDYPSPPSSPRLSSHQDQKPHKEGSTSSSTTVTPDISTSAGIPVESVADLDIQEKESSEGAQELEVSQLIALLGLEDWRCGSLTLKLLPCSNTVPKGNRAEIDSRIKAIVAFTQASPDLEDELDKLVLLVHCHWHDHGNHIATRVETWLKLFPAADVAIPVEKQIRKALGRISTQCKGTTKGGDQCKRKIGGQKVHNCTKTIDEIVKPDVYTNDIRLARYLEVLNANMLCHVHIIGQTGADVSVWQSGIVDIRNQSVSDLERKSGDLSDTVEEKTHGCSKQASADAQPKSKDRNDAKDEHLPLPSPARSPTPELEGDPSLFWPAEYDISPFDIIRSRKGAPKGAEYYDSIRRELMRPLDRTDQKHGFVYMYEVEGNKGFVKIGYTTRTTGTRHDEWAFDCNRVPKVLFDLPEPVPNARRVEALCHAVLEYCRVRIYCKACLKQHLEWFEISHAEAERVIRRWIKWMVTNPYEGTTLKPAEKQNAWDTKRLLRDLAIEEH